MRYRFGPWELDWDNRELRHKGVTVHVEPKVLQLLRLMLEQPGRLVTRETLTSQLWSDTVVGPDALTRLVKELRRVICDTSTEPQLLLTRRGHGYVFAGMVECETERCSPPFGDRTEVLRSNVVTSTTEDVTVPEQEELTAICIHWQRPSKRITIIKRPLITVLGRAVVCDEVLEGTGVSRKHAACSWQGPIAIVRDLGSRNGTYLNGQPVTETPLAVNDVIRIGCWLGVVDRVPSQPRRDFGLLARNFHGGHELHRLLVLAGTARQGGGVINIFGELGGGKTALSAAIHELHHGQGMLVRVCCGNDAREADDYPEAETLSFVKAMSRDELWTRDRSRTLVFDDVDALDREHIQRISSVVSQSGDTRGNHPLVITTSRTPISRLVASAPSANTGILALKGLELAVRPLRSRRSEILELSSVFFSHFGGAVPLLLSSRAAEGLLLHSWPLNLLELKRTMQQLSAQSGPDGRIDDHHLLTEFAEPRFR